VNAVDEQARDARRPRHPGPKGNVTPITQISSFRTRHTPQPRLELRQLYAFVAVAEELHFGRAAARLHVAQSPLSRIIRRLEEEIGAALFVRNNRSVRLTPAGETLLESAKALLFLENLAVSLLRPAALS